MTTTTTPIRLHPGASGHRAGIRGVLVLVAVLPALLGGCAVNLLGSRGGTTERRPAVKESALQKDLRELHEASALAPAAPYWPYRMAELYVAADSMARAESALAQSLARDPAYAPALSLQASLDYRAGRHARAIAALEAAFARPAAFPDGPPRELLEGLALHYEAIGQDMKARALVAGAPEAKRPGSAPVYLTLLGDRPELAKEPAEDAVRANPRSAANQNNVGITRLRAGDPEGARKAFERAIRIDPSLPGPYYNLAIVAKYYLFQDERAAEWFDLYWKRSRKDPDGLAGVFGKAARPELASED